MTEHTPGPWTVRADRGRYGTFQINPFAKEERAHLTKQPNAITLRGQKVQFEREANRRLIEAAPDLLAALEWLVDAHLMHAGYSVHGRPTTDLDDKLDKIADQFGGAFADHILGARAAIAKARGT